MKNLITCLTIGKTLILCITFRTRKRVYGCFSLQKDTGKPMKEARETRKHISINA